MKEIPLTQGKVALVDDEFFEALSQFKWCAHKKYKTFYACRNVKVADGHIVTRYMHHEVFALARLPIPDEIDHRDRDGLNNQLRNLRSATNTEQMRNRGKQLNNSSGYIGVSWSKSREKWESKIQINRSTVHLGRFDDPFSAAWVRDEFVKKHHGEFAVLNNLVDRRRASR